MTTPTKNAPHTILALFAHPDDEVLGSGGSLALSAAQGAQITLVCATRGEAGEIAIPALATPETLGQVREAEMLASAKALGLANVIFLEYRDSGMAGTTDNLRPEAFIRAPAGVVVPQLVAIMRQLKPEIVMTFEPFGGYGHPDHIAIHHHTLAAFAAAGDPTAYPEQGPPFQPNRLFYPILPFFMLEEMRQLIAAGGGDVSNFTLDRRQELGWPDDQLHLVMDVRQFMEAKIAAWNCHRTQFGPDSIFRLLPESTMRQLLSREYFALARPEPTPGLQLTHFWL